MTRYFVLLAALLWPVAAAADAAPDAVVLGNTIVFTLCDAQTSTGDCTRGGDEIVLDTAGFRSIAVDLSTSTATTIACDLKGNNAGHDATDPDGTGETLNSVSFSTSQYAISFEDTPRFVWLTCGTITGGNITATAVARREVK